MASTDAVLTQILSQLQVLQVAQQTMQAKVRSTFTYSPIYSAPFWYQLDVLSTQGKPPLEPIAILPPTSPPRSVYPQLESSPPSQPSLASSTPSSVPKQDLLSDKEREKLLYPGRVNLTSQSTLLIVDFLNSLPYCSLSRSTWHCATSPPLGSRRPYRSWSSHLFPSSFFNQTSQCHWCTFRFLLHLPRTFYSHGCTCTQS